MNNRDSSLIGCGERVLDCEAQSSLRLRYYQAGIKRKHIFTKYADIYRHVSWLPFIR